MGRFLQKSVFSLLPPATRHLDTGHWPPGKKKVDEKGQGRQRKLYRKNSESLASYAVVQDYVTSRLQHSLSKS